MSRKSSKPDAEIARTSSMAPDSHRMDSHSPRLVLIVDDNAQHAELAAQELSGEGIEAVHRGSAEEGLAFLHGNDVDVTLLDYHLPGMTGMEMLEELRRTWPHLPVIMVTGMGNEKVAVAALKAGASDYLVKESHLGYLEILPTIVRNAYDKNRLAIEVVRLRREASARHTFFNIVGSSAAMREVFRMLEAVSPSNATVLISGESGTGKELVARAVHHNGSRSDGPFIACNCGAIPENLVESELFGHERGAFTGATLRRIGSFESAHTGTLFLDEVSELPPAAQVSLLRAVQERQIVRLGSNKPIHVDVRIVAACNRDLSALVQQGQFREDLYYRLNVLTVELPPLRERGDDILLLAHTFLEQFAKESGKNVTGFSPDALKALEEYGWPGNVRELQHAVQRAVIVARSSSITCTDFPPAVRGSGPIGASRARRTYDLDANERELIAEVLAKTNWNFVHASKMLGTSRSTLYSKLERHGLRPPKKAV